MGEPHQLAEAGATPAAATKFVERKQMKSWRTTLGGVLAAIGMGVSELPFEWAAGVGKALSAIGLALLGLTARDNKVSSETAGAK